MEPVAKFTVSIDMGNDAMIDAMDVKSALKRISYDLSVGNYYVGHTQSIMDDNGNRVGSWKFHREGAE